jgi:hypothetical protein
VTLLRIIPLALIIVLIALAHAQSPTPSASQPTQPAAQPPAKVLFSRDADSQPDSPAPTAPTATPPQPTSSPTDAERTALTITAYDLDLHLTPASAAISARARLTLRNDSSAPLTRLVLQLSSSLHWDAFSTLTSSSTVQPLAFASHTIDTDADHTGQVTEAIVTLPHPLAPSASLTLTALYSGSIPPSAERLERIGAPTAQALAQDWDAIAGPNPDAPGNPEAPAGTALRGFGNVLWYPVAAAPALLGDANKLFRAVGETKLRESTATIRLRLAVEYIGDPPDAVFFCGRRQQLTAISDNRDLPVAESPGIATALFDAQPLGFRTPSLFITDRPASQTGTAANPTLISAVTGTYDALPAYAAAAALVEPLLTDWFGPRPLTTLNILDHRGQPFEDDALLVRPMLAVEPAALAPSLAHSLTHVWVRSTHPWIDEGLAQFASLLYTERTQGRAAALAELEDANHTLAFAEAEASAASSPPSPTGSPSQSSSSSDSTHTDASTTIPARPGLAAASSDVFYRTKAAAVFWMLRGIVGDDALKHALQAYRLDPSLDRDPSALQRTLERTSHTDLAWFFNDWVYRDPGLPDLTIVNVAPSPLEPHNGRPAGWLVAVDVRNDGAAVADVPVTVRSSTSTETQRLRIPARSSASIRIVFPGAPAEVLVNDGSVPESLTPTHTLQLTLPAH